MTVANPEAATILRRAAVLRALRGTLHRRAARAAGALRAIPHRRAAVAVEARAEIHAGVPVAVHTGARMAAVADTTTRSLPTNNRRGRFPKGSPRRLNFLRKIFLKKSELSLKGDQSAVTRCCDSALLPRNQVCNRSM